MHVLALMLPLTLGINASEYHQIAAAAADAIRIDGIAKQPMTALCPARALRTAPPSPAPLLAAC
ncbi:MAG: hypothetical protein PF961_12755 [Planctomycetota bacterium]|jgi:hypothetical protein|nr:hypothetical protein [Planctomycetota bacterium]